MFLEYGVSQSEQYTHISEVNSGRVPLYCPYCGQSLIARKGNKQKHHFSHDGTTCRWLNRDSIALSVPMFDRFYTFLDGRAWKQLQAFKHDHDANLRMLSDKELVYVNYSEQSSSYALTDLGKIPFGLTTLSTFADFQLSKITEQHFNLSETVRQAQFGLVDPYDTSTYQVEPNPEMVIPALTDLHIYRAQLARIFSLDLYLLEIKHNEGILYKIGVTSDIDRRILEIQRDLAHLHIKTIQSIQLLKQRGAVERYAQYRYRDYQKQIDSHTEYFTFDDSIKSKVLADFTQLGNFERADKDNAKYIPNYDHQLSRVLTRRGLITTIIDNESPEIEAIIKNDNTHNGTIEDIQKSDVHDDLVAKYPQVVAYLKQGESLRVIARKCRVSLTIVSRIDKIL